jgi:hypothetical protein
MGCITIDPKDSNVLWLGTGENQSQRSVGFGDGVYKSTDAGRTWSNVGLRQSEHIARILVDPRNSSVVWVASQGPLWAPGGDRGLFKTTDSGKTWAPALQVSENTGIADIAFDPRNADVVYAASYQRRRHQGLLVGGGPESTIYRTTDSGKSWSKVDKGLPAVDRGRIAIAVSPQSRHGLRARRAAAKEAASSAPSIAPPARMSSYIVVDPQYYGDLSDPHHRDASCRRRAHQRHRGRREDVQADGVEHPRHHAIAFDPRDPQHLWISGDGGPTRPSTAGRRGTSNLPITRFYNITVDERPFCNVCGARRTTGRCAAIAHAGSGRHPHERLDRVGGGDGMQPRRAWRPALVSPRANARYQRLTSDRA